MYKKLAIILIIFLVIFTGGCSKDHTISVSVEGDGKVITDKASHNYVNLIPVAKKGWIFEKWEGTDGNEVKYDEEYNMWSIFLDDNKSVTAHFSEFSLNLAIEGKGTVVKEKIQEINDSTNKNNPKIRLTAKPAENWSFSSWKGDISSTKNPVEIIIGEKKNITVVFEESPSISGNIVVDYDFTDIKTKEATKNSFKVNKTSLEGDSESNEIILGFSKGLSKAEKEQIIKEYNAKLKKYIDELDAAVVEISDNIENMKLQAQSSAEVRYLERNQRVSATGAAVPNDPLYNSQWNYRLIDLPQAWSKEKGNDIRVAVLDTGIKTDHPDLGKRIDLDNAYNFVSDNNDVSDDNGHGTHVAGIIGAVTDNGTGIAGTTWSGEILPLKVLDANGGGGYDAIAEAMLYAAGISDDLSNPEPVDLINLSLGGSYDSQLLKDAVKEVHEKGVLIVASSGNNNSSLLYPAKYSEVIAVGSVNSVGERASYSNYGPNLDVVAPGGDSYYGILSTYLDDEYKVMSGTSMAAPNVSGVISLMLESGISSDEIVNRLHKTSIHPGRDNFSEELGYGLINANFLLNNLNKVKVIIGYRNGNKIKKVAETIVPLKGGEYNFDHIPVGEYSLYAWIDVTGDDKINSGDYIKESDLIDFKPGMSYNKDLNLYIN